jgi:presenilin-like A22 family membrane protease
MGKMAIRKGQKPGMWKLYTVLAWIGGEIIGIIIAVVGFNNQDYISMLPLALGGAVGGYLIVRAILSKMPDKPDDGFEFENKTGT